MELLAFFRGLWRRKWWLVAFVLIPSLAFGLFLYRAPRQYVVDIDYQQTTNALNLEKLVNRFYSGENLAQIATRLEAQGLATMVTSMRALETEAEHRQWLDIRPTPDYIEYAKRGNVKLSMERSWAENVKKLEDLTADLLTFSLRGEGRADVGQAVACLRHNIEKELPLYEVRDILSSAIYGINRGIADIERKRGNDRLELETLKRVLEGLRGLTRSTTGDSNFELKLSFENPSQDNRFLPLGLQIQTAEAQMVTLAETIEDEKRRHVYFMQLLALLRGLEAALDQSLSRGLDLDGYLALVEEAGAKVENPEARDYLAAHGRDVENLRLMRTPLTQNPMPRPIAKGTIKKTALLATVLLVAGVFLISLWNYLAHVAGAASRGPSARD